MDSVFGVRIRRAEGKDELVLMVTRDVAFELAKAMMGVAYTATPGHVAKVSCGGVTVMNPEIENGTGEPPRLLIPRPGLVPHEGRPFAEPLPLTGRPR